jgi:hypothetical protein
MRDLSQRVGSLRCLRIHIRQLANNPSPTPNLDAVMFSAQATRVCQHSLIRVVIAKRGIYDRIFGIEKIDPVDRHGTPPLCLSGSDPAHTAEPRSRCRRN